MSDIGSNAGLIWNYLDAERESALNEMQKELKITEQELFLAIGWLARESKIVIFEKGKTLFASLVY